MSVGDLQKEIKQLRLELQNERQEREKLARYIKEQLAKHSEQESANTAKIGQITSWIKDNLGANLEHVKRLISESVPKSQENSSKDLFKDSILTGNKVFGEEPVNKPIPVISGPGRNTIPTPPPSGKSVPFPTPKKTEDSNHKAESKPMPTKSTGMPESPSSKEAKDTPSKKEPFFNMFSAPDFDQPVDEQAHYVSDEEWSSSDDEIEDRIVPKNERIAQLESSYIPLPTRLAEDSSVIPTTARVNIEHSVQLHSSIYKITTEDIIPKLRSFSSKGGKVLFVPPDRQKFPFAFGIKSADQLYPICPDGLSRSQILYLVLKGVKRSLGREKGIHLPHGSVAGYDASTMGETIGTKLHALGPTHINKNWKKETPHKQQMKDFFDLYYYKQPQKNNQQGKIVFITFGSSLIPVMERLDEVNQGKLDNIYVIAMPFQNEMNVAQDNLEWKRSGMPKEQYSYRKHLEHYKEYASLFVPLKDEHSGK